MEELFKRLVYTGVGIAALTVDKITELVDELVKEEKLSADEGKKIVDEFVKSAEEKKTEFESQLKTVVDKFSENVNFSFKDGHKEEVEDLKERIRVLEEQAASTKTAEKADPASE